MTIDTIDAGMRPLKQEDRVMIKFGHCAGSVVASHAIPSEIGYMLAHKADI